MNTETTEKLQYVAPTVTDYGTLNSKTEAGTASS